MQREFRLKTIGLALMAAFPLMPAWAAEPYPPLPPALSTSVAPNIVLYLDTSGSMLQDSNNNWMLTNLCDSVNSGWNWCVNNNWNGYRTAIDSEATSPNTKMNIAKRVARNLVNANRSLRFGVFSFRDRQADIGGTERSQAAIMRAAVRDVVKDADRDVITNAITGLYGRTATPLAEGLLEITRYYSGQASLYGLSGGQAYTSPIQYRCQKNFAIIITDGDASNDQNLPGTGLWGEDNNSPIAALSYTARDTSGNAVSKTFSICSAAGSPAGSSTDDGYNVTCPSTYDSDGSARTFWNAGVSAYPGALRDVAMFANRADLRIGGNDLDSKSFDDPQFPLQNLITYTVGFTVNNAVLPSAAKVGGGKYYNANNEQQLTDSLNNVIASIGDMTSNAGGMAVKSDTTVAGNKIYQPVFNPKGWFGELRCYVSGSTTSSTSLGTACSPNAKATIPVATSRKIYTSKVVGQTTTAFDFTTSNLTTMTTSQQASLGSAANNALEQKNVISFIRGETISGYRTRNNGLLGDIIDGQPVSVAAPSGSSADASYGIFQQTNANRELVFVGANDGMLHGFKSADMSEVMGYIPSPVYRNLKSLKETNYGDSAGTPHAYFVNGELRKADIKAGNTWKTILVGGLAQGGQGYYAIDATSETVLGTNASVKWEWTDVNDAEVGYTFGAPIIYNVRTGAKTAAPAVILSNGYENTFDDTASGGQKAAAKSSVLYILNADTGAIIKKITVPSTAAIPSEGLSSPAGLDIGQDGVLDYVYAGDINGNLWRFDLTASDPQQFSVASTPLFRAGRPIITRPALLNVRKRENDESLGHLVFFGTGKLLVDADRSDTSTDTFYGVLDDMSATVMTLTKANLVQRTVEDVKTVSGTGYLEGSFRKISTSPDLDLRSGTSSAKGWYLDLPEVSERLVTSPLLLSNRLFFGTGIPKAAEQCVPGGKGWIMGLNPLTGSVTKSATDKEFSVIDVKLDGRSTDDDKVNFQGGAAFVSGYAVNGIPTELTFVSNSSSKSVPGGTNGGLGDWGAMMAVEGANAMGVYTGGQPTGGGVTTGSPVPKPDGDSGCLYSGVGGKSSAGCLNTPPATSTVKMETTLWREIK